MTTDYKYYVYSSTIARADPANCEVSCKNHKTGSWQNVTDPNLWKDILTNGQEVKEEDANKIYNVFHKEMKEDEKLNPRQHH